MRPVPPTPVFLLSLPRSGSTLTQRVLAAHDGVATAAEPWVLLPLLSVLRADLPLNDSWQRTVAGAMQDFIAQLPNGRQDYFEAASTMARDLYARASPPDARLFLDKTPPYHHIGDELIEMFPEGRFVFLWRHPLAVLSSIMETLANGRWKVYEYRGDLFHGLDNLVRTFERHGDRVYGVRYEDLVTGTDAWHGLSDYLGLAFDPAALERFAAVRFEGRMGDPTGVHRYQQMSSEPLTKWRATINNAVRKEWARRWLLWIGRERLAVMGYDLGQLLDELAATETTRDGVGADLRELTAGATREAVKHRTGDRRYASSFSLLRDRR